MQQQRLRYHFSQTKDVSNISREDAIRSFSLPYLPNRIAR